MSTPDPPRRPSSIDALGEAVSHMRAKLFSFNFLGWLTLGFVTWLETPSSGTAGLKRQNQAPDTIGDPTRMVESAFGWIAAHMLIFVGALVLIMFLSLLIVWLRSRAIFVYIDDVATGRFDLVRPWNEHGGHADSFFVLSLVIQGASFILVVLILGFGGFFALWANAHEWAGLAIALGLIPIFFFFFLALIVAGLINMALRDFVAPLQISRNVGAREASGVFLSLLASNPGVLIGYAFVKFLVTIGVGVVVGLLVCLTCCVGGLPLLHQTLFQPIYYAERAWSLKLLAQLGEDVFGRLAPKAAPSTPQHVEAAPVAPYSVPPEYTGGDPNAG